MSDFPLHTRREFMGKGLTILSATATVPAFLDRTAWVMADPLDVKSVRSAPGKPDDRILVVLQLAGGNDGLNTVIPYRNDDYHKARPRLAFAQDKVLKLTDEIGLHPQAVGLKKLYDDGLLGIVQGVGYPNPERSHFVATDIWSTASPDNKFHDGWLGRYFDCSCKGPDRPDPKRGIAVVREAPLAMMGERFSPVSFSTPQELAWRTPNGNAHLSETFEELNKGDAAGGEVVHPANEKEALSYLRRVAMDAMAGAREIQSAAGEGGRAGRYARRLAAGQLGGGRSQLSQALQMVRRMIAAGLGTRVYYVSLGGFDTHAGQIQRHQALMTQLGDALSEFVTGLKQDGHLDKVLLVTFSEFGRRVTENASGGTDHGAAAPLFVVGGRVKPGLHGTYPSLEPAKLDRDDLKWTTDFRAVYAGILSSWLAADAVKILGGRFGNMNLIR